MAAGRESVVAAMGRAYRDPRAEMARQVGGGLAEARSLFHLFLGCGLALVASLPAALRQAADLDVADAVSAAVAAHIFGFIFVAPLLMYGVAALLHLAARAFGARGSFLGARAALFWAVALGGPIALAISTAALVGEALAGGAARGALDLLGYAGGLYWLWLLAANLAETEGFAGTLRIAAVLVAAFGAVAVAVASLGASGAATG